MTFFAQLAERSRQAGSLLCVGLDPDIAKLRADEVADFNRRLIAETVPYAACYKPNIAFYEQYGIPGLRALEATLAAIPAGIPVIGDGKRGDIGNTAAAYARAMFEEWGFGAVTVNPYMGRDTIEPFLAYRDRGVFVLCRTSNPGAAELQNARIEGDERVFERIAREAPGWGANVGLVVGATAPDELRRVRELAPETPLLVPGLGSQGGDAAAVVAAAGDIPGRVVVNASRTIAGAEDPAAAARALRDALNQRTPVG